MVSALFDITPLIPALEQGELILTANNRLRSHILRAYAAHQKTQGQQTWLTPSIYPLNHWLRACWQELQDQSHRPAQVMIINTFQRQHLWEDIITHSSFGNALLQPEPLAQSADSALRNLELWRLTSADLANNENHNAQCFREWLVDFNERLTQANQITEEAAHYIIAQAFNAAVLKPLPRIYLQGFDDIPPLYQALLAAASTEIIDLPGPQPTNNTVKRVSPLNDSSEIRAAALWSKKELEQDADAIIGIIVPNLGQCRDQVERIFTEVFEPLAKMPDQPRYTLPFNFSAGTPLAATPVIHTALELLNLNRSLWDLEPLCNLLQSPFFGNADAEMVVRALLCERLRKLGKFTISTNDLRYHSQRLCEKLGLTHDDTLAARFIALETNRRASFGQHPAAYWINLFQQQLSSLGWPGTRRLDSQEYQQVKLWHKVLDDFACLDSNTIRLDINQALNQLRNIAGKTPFQAQTPDSPIQILGALEGAGLQFTHCWVLGLHHRQWPPVPTPNPLLPLSLQREHNMPHSSAERELVFATALTENYRHCAQQVIFSSAHTDSESELRPSALIRAIPLTPLDELLPQIISCSQENLRIIANAKQWELLQSSEGPVLQLNNSPVRGGSSLFKHQAACPFNAFTRLRLGARQLESAVPGFSAIERGNILHDALAIIWRQIGNSRQLHALTENALHALLVEATAAALKPLQQQRPKELGNFYCQLEQKRLIKLLTAWLEQEKMRPAFTVISIEEERQISFAGLVLKLRIDRIDQLENGELLLIDYKTGSPKAKSWLGERPDEPQLPLYAVSHSESVSAIAFAQINAKAIQWIGTGELSVDHEGIKAPVTDWPQQMDEWQQTLAALAQAFIGGDARVDFKDINAQQYAEDLEPLNRIREAHAIRELLASGKMTLVGGHT